MHHVHLCISTYAYIYDAIDDAFVPRMTLISILIYFLFFVSLFINLIIIFHFPPVTINFGVIELLLVFDFRDE